MPSQRNSSTAQPLLDDRRTFRIACHISHTLGYNFLKRFVESPAGQLMESLQTVALACPGGPEHGTYLAAFSTQHKDEQFHKADRGPFPAAAHSAGSENKAWLTDTFAEVNGVSRTIQVLAQTAQDRPKAGLTVHHQCRAIRRPRSKIDLKNFPPVGTFPMPEYESQTVAFPPFLEIVE